MACPVRRWNMAAGSPRRGGPSSATSKATASSRARTVTVIAPVRIVDEDVEDLA
jgi:hypothetical protein